VQRLFAEAVRTCNSKGYSGGVFEMKGAMKTVVRAEVREIKIFWAMDY
jgi:hypothetical protein